MKKFVGWRFIWKKNKSFLDGVYRSGTARRMCETHPKIYGKDRGRWRAVYR